MRKEINIYTDGAYGKSLKSKDSKQKRVDVGSGLVVFDIDGKVESLWAGSSTIYSTSNIAELKALLKAVEIASEVEDGTNVIIHSDSRYSIRSTTEWIIGWRRYGWVNYEGEPVKNKYLIQKIADILNKNKHIQLKWVKAHSGVLGNELADRMAVLAKINDIHIWTEVMKTNDDIPYEKILEDIGEDRRGRFNIEDIKQPINIDYLVYENLDGVRVDREQLMKMIENGVDVTNVDVRDIRDMSGLFMNCYNFNQDISGWDVKHVSRMDGMFDGAKHFNQPIGIWSLSVYIKTIEGMFANTDDFNQDLCDWLDNKIYTINMSEMFFNAKSIQFDIFGKYDWDRGYDNITDIYTDSPLEPYQNIMMGMSYKEQLDKKHQIARVTEPKVNISIFKKRNSDDQSSNINRVHRYR